MHPALANTRLQTKTAYYSRLVTLRLYLPYPCSAWTYIVHYLNKVVRFLFETGVLHLPRTLSRTPMHEWSYKSSFLVYSLVLFKRQAWLLGQESHVLMSIYC